MADEVSALLVALKATQDALKTTQDALKVAEERARSAEQQAKAPKKHKFGVTNPLLFPASLYNRHLIEINQPFLSFLKTPPATDKVRKKQIPDEVLQHALTEALLRPMGSMDRICKWRLGQRPWHWSLLQGYGYLAKISPESARKVHELEVMAGLATEENTEEEVCDESCVWVEGEGDGDEPDDQDIRLENVTEEEEDEEEEEEEEEAGTSTETSQLSFGVSHESNRQDFCVKVLDTLVYKKQANAWVTVLVIECKEPLTENGIWQAVKYAIREGLINIEKGRVAPIYVMQWSSGSWSYGLIDIYGALRIENGVISDDSFEEFVMHQKARWLYAGKKADEFKPDARFTKDVLASQLLKRKQILRRRCSSIKGIDYPDDTYLVGRVYVNSRKCDLPNVLNLGRLGSVDANRFYEGLLKIIIGKKAETWTKEDVDAAVKAREDELTRILQATTAPIHPRARPAACGGSAYTPHHRKGANRGEDRKRRKLG